MGCRVTRAEALDGQGIVFGFDVEEGVRHAVVAEGFDDIEVDRVTDAMPLPARRPFLHQSRALGVETRVPLRTQIIRHAGAAVTARFAEQHMAYGAGMIPVNRGGDQTLVVIFEYADISQRIGARSQTVEPIIGEQ